MLWSSFILLFLISKVFKFLSFSKDFKDLRLLKLILTNSKVCWFSLLNEILSKSCFILNNEVCLNLFHYLPPF